MKTAKTLWLKTAENLITHCLLICYFKEPRCLANMTFNFKLVV